MLFESSLFARVTFVLSDSAARTHPLLHTPLTSYLRTKPRVDSSNPGSSRKPPLPPPSVDADKEPKKPSKDLHVMWDKDEPASRPTQSGSHHDKAAPVFEENGGKLKVKDRSMSVGAQAQARDRAVLRELEQEVRPGLHV
jgi:hypothetical protein